MESNSDILRRDAVVTSLVPDVSKGRGSVIFTLWSVEIFGTLHPLLVVRDNSVGMETGYGLDGPVIKSRWGRDFPHPFKPALRPTQPPMQWVTGLFPGGKAARSWSWSPTPFSAEVKERVELYLFSPSGSSWRVLGWPLPLLSPIIPLQSIWRYHKQDFAIGPTQGCTISGHLFSRAAIQIQCISLTLVLHYYKKKKRS